MSSSVSIKFDPSRAFAALDKLEAAADDNIRPAAQAAAQVLYEEVRLRVPDSKKEHYFYGKAYRTDGTFYGVGGSNRVGPIAPFRPGNLRDSIYQVFSKDNSAEQRATYHISWNKAKAPYGYWVEFGFGAGTVPASPFLRPAFDAAGQRAAQAARARWTDGMRTVIANLK